jgi:hypothetical protein
MGAASGTVADQRKTYLALVGKPEGKIPLEDLGVNLTVILRWLYKK